MGNLYVKFFLLPDYFCWVYCGEINLFMKIMIERYKVIDGIMAIVADIVREVVERKRSDMKEKGEGVDMAEVKKCMDVVRDISEISLKMVKYEREIERYGGNEQELIMQKTQDVYDLFEEFKVSFSPKKLKEMIDMKREDVMVVMERTMRNLKKKRDDDERKLQERQQYVYTKFLDDYLKESGE